MKKSYKDIREFIEALDAAGELVRHKEKISPEIEISKITDAESKKAGGGKALLFENVWDNGRQSFPVATNLFGSDKRMAMALGLAKLDETGDEIETLINTAPPKSVADFFEVAKKALPLLRIMPRRTKKAAPCQEVVQKGADIDLSAIPVLKCWPYDGGRFVTLPLVFTKSPDGKKRNLGMYRLQIFDKKTTGMHWHVHKDGSHFFKEHADLKMRMPVAVAIGADPATIYAATAPMPRGLDELLLAGFFRKKGVPMVKCVSVDLEVPADAEFVLEGFVDYEERRLEGPFGDHTGYYSLADMYPVFHITAITRKKEPIYCATLVGPPPMEDCYMAKATERIFLPLLRSVMPEVCDYFLPWEGVFHNIVVVSIEKEYPAHAQKLISGFWGQGQMSFCKCVVVVDRDVRPNDLAKIWKMFLENFDPSEDIFLSYGVLDVLDHSSPKAFMGAKIGIDLTRRMRGEGARKTKKPAPLSLENMSEIEKFLSQKFGESYRGINPENNFCAISIAKDGRSGAEILNALAESGLFDKSFRAVGVFDPSVNISDYSKLLWKIFNNVDPSRDIKATPSGVCYIDACRKGILDGHPREWPEDLAFDK